MIDAEFRKNVTAGRVKIAILAYVFFVERADAFCIARRKENWWRRIRKKKRNE